jgi:hypothetical protein
MRLILPAALLLLTACGVDNDPANEKVTVTYDREKINKAGRAAKDVAVSAGNVAKTTGKAIKKEVGDVDVDVKVSRNKGDATPAQ